MHMGIIYMKIPKAAHQCDVRGNSNITAIEKKGVVHFQITHFCSLSHEETLLFGQIISTFNKKILFTFMKSVTPKFVLKS